MTSTAPAAPAPSPHAEEANAVALGLGSDPDSGLTAARASKALITDGPNEIPAAKQPRWIQRLAREFRSPMSVLLILAAAVSGLVIRAATDAAVILAIVVLNAVVAVVQEGKASQALAALRTFESPTTVVIRDGRLLRVPVRDLVRGDVVHVSAGDRVPADLRLISVESSQADESTLTGESLPVDKTTAPLGVEVGQSDRTNMAFAGTSIVRGTATGVVVATGARTRLGKLATGLSTSPPPTPLQIELTSVTRHLGAAAVAVSVIVFIAMVGIGGGQSVESAFLVAVALAVAAVPEGLPTVVTMGLALGVRRMAHHGVIVKRLDAVETLGSTTALLTDKTGTLTENALVVESIRSPSGHPVTTDHPLRREVAVALVACTAASLDPPEGDPVDLAILRALRIEEAVAPIRRLRTVPFDSGRRRMTVILDGATGPQMAVKGAPEELLPRCATYVGEDGSVRPLRAPMVESVADRIAAWAQEGTRVIALATKPLTAIPSDPDTEEHELVLLALIGLHDPVRPAARAAVQEASAAGVEVVMVTGDHPGTARAVADVVGIPPGTTLTGTDLATGLPAELNNPVFARVEPEQKLALVEWYQSHGHVVAVTGDGVNDAPALRRADIGAAMGRRGSDVAQEAADLVIVDDDLSTIVVAVREGRAIYDNIRKVIDYLVAGNLSEILVVVAALFLAGEAASALTPVQILWLNLLTDGLPALALGVDTPTQNLMLRPPRPRTERLLGTKRVVSLAQTGVILAIGPVCAFAVSRWLLTDEAPVARTVLFTTLVLAHLLYAFAVRNPHQPVNRRLVAAVGTSAVLQVALVLIAPLGAVFDVVAVGLHHGLLILVAAGLPVTVLLVRRRRTARVGSGSAGVPAPRQ